jgi:hypothetical protein
MFEEAESRRVFAAAVKKSRAKEIHRKADQGAGWISFDSFLWKQRKNIELR